MTLQLRSEREERNQLKQQMSTLEAQLRKAHDAQANLHRQVCGATHASMAMSQGYRPEWGTCGEPGDHENESCKHGS